MLAETIAHNSSVEIYTERFKRKKITVEQSPLNFTSTNDKCITKQFSMRELLDSLTKAHDTAVGPDAIHDQILKQMPHQTLEVPVERSLHHPNSKSRKNISDHGNYRPIA